MQCTNCGQPLAPGAGQCAACGAPVAAAVFQSQPPVVIAPQQPGAVPPAPAGQPAAQPSPAIEPQPAAGTYQPAQQPPAQPYAYAPQPVPQVYAGQPAPQTPAGPSQQAAPSAVSEVAKNAAITAKLAMAVAVLNALLTIFLGVGATEAGKTNYLAMLLILLPTGALLWFGWQLLRISKAGLAEIDSLIRQRILPVVAAAAVIGLLSGSGGIGLLPVVMVFFAVRTLQKIAEAKKRAG